MAHSPISDGIDEPSMTHSPDSGDDLQSAPGTKPGASNALEIDQPDKLEPAEHEAEHDEDPERLKSFDDPRIPADLRASIEKMGWTAPTPVQTASFAPVTDGRDVLVQSQTGTGKTGAFCLPWLAARFEASDARDTGVQLLVLVPTRELAKQVCGQLEDLAGSKASTLAVYGGTAMQPQLQALEAGIHAVVGTPGRILDHIRRRTLDLSRVRMVVLDEADEMLSMGFLEDIHAILQACPAEGRQTTLFSATVPTDVERIARRYMRQPITVKLSGDQVAAAQISHGYFSIAGSLRTRDLIDIINVAEPPTGLIFCNTREETSTVAAVLRREGYSAEALSSDLTQTARERVLGLMRAGKLRFLVATDVASRGIDISHISHVINYTFPENAESYIHRTGRTGRAGRDGQALSLIGPRDLGNFYYLKLQYPTLNFEERALPSSDELEAQRIQTKLDRVSASFSEPVAPEWMLLARQLLADPRGEAVVAYLLSEAHAKRPEPTSSDFEASLRERRDSFSSPASSEPRSRGRRGGSRERNEDDVSRGDVRPVHPSGKEAAPREAEAAEGDDPARRGRRRRRSRGGPRDEGSTTHHERRPSAEPSMQAETIRATETSAPAPDSHQTMEDHATALPGTAPLAVALTTATPTSGEDAPEGPWTSGPTTAEFATPTDAGDTAQPRRRRRRRRRRGEERGDAQEGSSELEAGTSDEEGESAVDVASTDTATDAATSDPAESKRRGRKRRRRSGPRAKSDQDTPAVPRRAEAVTLDVDSAAHVAQDQIIIDIDESELEVVRGEFGEIDELDDLTLKGRRRGVIDALQDEVELVDMSSRDGAADADPETDLSDGEDEADGDMDASGHESEESSEATSSEDPGKKRRRRRRKKKKPEVVETPELTAPPHKDFWEVWAAKFTYSEFEDEVFYKGEPIPTDDDDVVEPDSPTEHVSDGLAGFESSEDDGPFVTVELSIGRAHRKKAAQIRELLATEFRIGGRAVRDLTVGETNSRFRVSEQNCHVLQRGLLGYVFDGVELEVTRVEEPTTSEPVSDPVSEGEANATANGGNESSTGAPDPLQPSTSAEINLG